MNLEDKTVCITGGAHRIGRILALAAAEKGASIILHYGKSREKADETKKMLQDLGAHVDLIQADFSNPQKAIEKFVPVFNSTTNLYGLVNNASVFKQTKFHETTLVDWHTHIDINLTIPFLLSQAFQKSLNGRKGKIINILDWRALRPGRDHFPYTISKAALASMTKATALATAPTITVNGLALGAILPPSDGSTDFDGIIKPVPMARWANPEELVSLFTYLLTAPDFITGEIIHLDGGRHLV